MGGVRGVVGLVVLALASCVQPSSTQCNGYVCPDKTVCDTVNGGCVLPEQLETCVGMADNVDCNIAGQPLGFCKNGVCVASRCGDGVVRGTERCDGENLDGQTCSTLGYYTGGDVSCANDCLFDTSSCGGGKCGDHIVQHDHEFCEDGVAPTELSCLDFGFDLGRLGCAQTCQPAFDACEHFGFFPVVTNTIGSLRSVWAAASNDVYIAGDGILRHFDGKDWATIDLGSTASIIDVSGSSAHDIWAVGEDRAVFHYDGTAWTAMMIPETIPYTLEAVWALGPDNVFVVGNDEVNLSNPNYGYLAHWNGTVWNATTVPTGMYDVWATSSTSADASAESGVTYHWDGNQWVATTLDGNSLFAIWGTGPNDVWTGGTAGLFHRTSTGWSSVPMPASRNIFSITGAGNRVFFGANDGVMLYDGNAFVSIPAPQFNWMWANAPTDVFAVSPFGAVRRFTGRAWLDDGNTLTAARTISASNASYAVVADLSTPAIAQVWDGVSWTTMPSSGLNRIQSFYIAAPGDVVAVGSGAAHYYTDSSGTSWHPMTGTVGTLTGVWGRSTSDMFAVANGVGGRIFHSSGTTWAAMTSNTTQSLSAVWGTATEVFVVGIGVIDHYDGQTWTPMMLPAGNHSYNAVWGTANNNVYAGSVGQIHHWDGSNWTVSVANLDFTVRSISGTGPNDITAVGTLGAMVHFDGINWSPVRVPTTQSLAAVAVTPTRVFVAGADGTQLLLLP